MPQSPLVQDDSSKNVIDLKTNGEVSRMRSHRGNMPSLPQTKYCALCPAKFTRTTHLNRHLRSHTNERAHQCSICNAEFTRSDLLTRHKRTCGDSNVNRSRRKSCQACADSKVKCNLQQPCSKCAARGRECVFINDPEASRKRKLAQKAARSSQSLSPLEINSHESPTSSPPHDSSTPTSALSIPSQGQKVHAHLAPSSHDGHIQSDASHGPSVASNASDCSSSACSSQSSPRLDVFEQPQLSNPYQIGFNSLEVDSDSDLNEYFPTGLSEPVMDDAFSPPLPRTHVESGFPTWFETTHPSAPYGNSEPNLYNHPHCQTNDQNFVNGSTNLNLNPSSSGKASFPRQQFSTILPVQNAAVLNPSSAPRTPIPEELNHFLYLFSTEYSDQFPLLHRPTWKMEMTHPLLISAMQACGALLVKTQTAMEFIIRILTSSQDTLIAEFIKPVCTLRDRMDIVLAVILLQSIISFQSRAEQRVMSKVYHEILVMLITHPLGTHTFTFQMIRKIGLIKLVSSWTPPDLSRPQVADMAWNSWAQYETFKRALALAFVQDCSQCVYYSASPAFHESEFVINLPCDDELWMAQTAREWYQMQSLLSTYGTGTSRILGVSMQMALTAVKESVSSAIPFIVNPFATFVVIHSILRNVFSSSGMDNTLEVQSALHNWQRMWGSSPEALHVEQQLHNVPYVFNAMPFYWLARFAEEGKQNGVFPALSRVGEFSRVGAEDRYRIVKGWLSHINTTLLNGDSHMSLSLGSNSIGAMGLSTFSHGL